MRNKTIIVMCTIVVGAGVLACSSSEDVQSAQDSLTVNQVFADRSGTILSQNVYQLNAVGRVVAFTKLDGHGAVIHEASAAEIESATITADGTCASSDLMMFDQTGFAGNKLCLYISGGSSGSQACLDLTQTLRVRQGCCNWLNWSNAVRSFKSNSQHGFFYQTSTTPCDSIHETCGESFTTSENESPVTSCTQFSQSLNLVD